jgi:hypothetical protein
MQDKDTPETFKGSTPDESIISDQFQKRIVEGELITVKTSSGSKHHFRVVGLHFENDEVLARTGNAILENTRRYADSDGVYMVGVMVSGRRGAHPHRFFPRGWTWEQVAQAIEEAYANRQPRKGDTSGKLFEGVSSSGIRVMLEFDDAGGLLDAFPIRKGRAKNKQQALWLYRQGKIDRPRYICSQCDQLKVLVCERGHNLPASLLDGFGLRWLLKRKFLKLKKAVKKYLR